MILLAGLSAAPYCRKMGVATSIGKTRLGVVLTILAIAGASCSSSPSESLAFDDPAPASTTPVSTTVVEAPSATVDVEESSEVIAFQADWLCELQRRTFPDLDAADVALTESLARAGVSRSTYDEFLVTLPESQELRDEVLGLFAQRCRA